MISNEIVLNFIVIAELELVRAERFYELLQITLIQELFLLGKIQLNYPLPTGPFEPFK